MVELEQFNTENSSDSVYSFGIMIPVSEVLKFMQVDELPENLDEFLEIKKYEEPETSYSGLSKGALPIGMYSTDEPNIMNLNRTNYPITLTGTVKYDGSSESIYYKDDENFGICSRNLEKSLEQKLVTGYTNNENHKIRKHILFNKETNEKTLGWFNDNTNEFFENVQDDWIDVIKEVDDTFVKLGTPVLEKLKEYCKNNNKQLALRGELIGEGLKGSGNKNNPHAKLKQGIKFYGLDDYSSGVTRKKSLNDFYSLMETLELEYCDIVFKDITFNSFDEIKEKCNEFFKTNLIEGIVLRNNDCTFSAKFMNPEYDSKK